MPDPPLDPLAASFGRVAAAYDLGRPSYPPEALAWLVSELGLGAAATVLDLAAGTGKLTAGLVPLVGRVIAVEPVAEMRRLLAAGQPAAEVLEGTAEAIPLATGAVDAVMVAAAFHWFTPTPPWPRSTGCCARAAASACCGTGRSGRASRGTRPSPRCSTRARAGQGDPPNRYTVGEWRAALERSTLFGPVRKREFRHVHRVSRDGVPRPGGVVERRRRPARGRPRGRCSPRWGSCSRGHGVTALDLRYRTDAYRARAHPAAGRR